MGLKVTLLSGGLEGGALLSPEQMVAILSLSEEGRDLMRLALARHESEAAARETAVPR